MMDGTFIDVVIKKLQWLLDHPEVTWSGSGIYALSLAVSAALAVASWCFWRKKKSPPSSEEHLRQPLPAQNITNQFNSNGGEQTNLQGDHGIAKQINNYSNISPDALADVRKLAVTESALSSFFNILQREQMPLWELDSELRKLAFQHIELKQQVEVGKSDDQQVQALKELAGQAIEGADYNRVEELLNQAKERDRVAVAKLKANIAEQQTAQEKRQLSEAQSCAGQAMLQRLQYRYEKSAQYWQEAAAALPEGHKAERADYIGGAGYDLYRISRYTEALRLYEQSLSIAREIGDRKQEGAMLNNIGLIYKDQGEYGKALAYLEQSLPIFREVGNQKGEGTTLNNIATIYFSKGDYPNALNLFDQCLALSKEIHDKENEVRTLNNIGAICRKQPDDAAALRYYNQALSISCEIENKYLKSKTLNNIGQVYFEQGKLDAALEKLQQSLVIDRQISDRKGEGITLNNIGKIYEAKGDYAAALKQYEQALAITKEIGAKEEEIAISGNIGMLYKKQGELAKAEPYLSRTVELMEQMKHPDLEAAREALELVRAKLRGNGNNGHNT